MRRRIVLVHFIFGRQTASVSASPGYITSVTTGTTPHDPDVLTYSRYLISTNYTGFIRANKKVSSYTIHSTVVFRGSGIERVKEQAADKDKEEATRTREGHRGRNSGASASDRYIGSNSDAVAERAIVTSLVYKSSVPESSLWSLCIEAM
jgi:hypothetical protein